MLRKLGFASAALALLFGGASWLAAGVASASGPSVVRSGPPGENEPPAFAYQACADKEEGAACSVSFDGRSIYGSCVLALDERLFCLPDPPPARPPTGSLSAPSGARVKRERDMAGPSE